MKIEACREDLATTYGSILVLLLCEFVLLFIWSWNVIIVILFAILDLFLAVFFIKDIVYFGRSISLDGKGCTFSFLGMQKQISWEDMTVSVLESESAHFYDAEVCSSGVLLLPKSRKYRTAIAPMTFCRYKCASGSVYICFCDDGVQVKSGKTIYKGYSAHKIELLQFFESNEISINNLED